MENSVHNGFVSDSSLQPSPFHRVHQHLFGRGAAAAAGSHLFSPIHVDQTAIQSSLRRHGAPGFPPFSSTSDHRNINTRRFGFEDPSYRPAAAPNASGLGELEERNRALAAELATKENELQLQVMRSSAMDAELTKADEEIVALRHRVGEQEVCEKQLSEEIEVLKSPRAPRSPKSSAVRGKDKHVARMRSGSVTKELTAAQEATATILFEVTSNLVICSSIYVE